ncbi:MAG: tetratricopeptide repeat protein [Flavobacteriales bacterium]
MSHTRVVLKSNKALLGNRSNIFERGGRFSRVRKEYLASIEKNLSYKTATPAQLAEIRSRIVQNRKEARIRGILIVLAFTPFIAIGGYFMIQSIQESNLQAREFQIARLEAQNLIKRKKYADLVLDGDLWLRRNHWHNAIFQYKVALELFPQDYGINNRLAIAYTYRCRAEKQNCPEAKAFIDKIIKAHPDDPKNYELLASYYFGLEDSLKASNALNRATLLTTQTID